MVTLEAFLLRLSIFVLLATAIFMAPAHAVQVPGPVVDTAWLDKHLDDVILLEVPADTVRFQGAGRYQVTRKGGGS